MAEPKNKGLFQEQGKAGGGAKMRFNMVDIPEDQGFSAVPPGVYPCRVHDCSFKYSSKGNPMWEVVFETKDKVDGRFARFWHYVLWTEEQQGRTKRFLMRVAPDILKSPKAKDLNPEDQEVINMVVSKDCRVRVTVEQYDGENRNRVKDVLPGGDANSFF